MSLRNHADPFSTLAIRPLPQLNLEYSATWQGFRFDNSLESGLLRLNDVDTNPLSDLKPKAFHLDVQDVPLPDLSNPSSGPSSDSETEPQPGQESEKTVDETPEVWVLPDVYKRKPQDKLISWDTFLDKDHEEPPTPYISETGPRTFNKTLKSSNESAAPKPIRQDALLNAVFELAMGRSSALFEWDDKNDRFSQCWDNIGAYGFSTSLLQEYLEEFRKIGAYTRKLKTCFERLDRQRQPTSPSEIAFLAASRSALFATHEYLEKLRPDIVSLLQLKGAMTRVVTILNVLGSIVHAVQDCQTDNAMVLALMRHADNASFSHPGIDRVLQEIFTRALQPLSTRLCAEIGLVASGANDPQLTTIACEEAEDIYSSLFGADLGHAINETRHSLQLLQSHAPHCRVLAATVHCASSSGLTLEPGYAFDAICKIQAKSVAYEEAVKCSILLVQSPALETPLHCAHLVTSEGEEAEITGLTSANPFQLDTRLFEDHAPIIDHNKTDEVHEQVKVYLRNNNVVEVSPFQLSYAQALTLSITPLVSAQHRLLSFSVLQLLFQQHNLLAHLEIQREFHLFGNAFFSSRLSMALFDSDQASGEGHRSTGAPTGLRLQARETWPPAGSELRLVLMGILSDSLATATSETERRLEDTISFAIRDMPVDELEKCRDVNSIHALDFLRLEYKPPNELVQTVLTPAVLDKYDRVFGHLLRLSRIHCLTQSMLRNNVEAGTLPGDHKVVVHMHHFISVVVEYCHNTAVPVCWGRFERLVREVERHVANNDYDRTLQLVKSQGYLGRLHERALDRLLHALLLRRKQAGARQFLEELLTMILRFAAERKSMKTMARAGHNVDDQAYDATKIRRFAEDFAAKATQFMDALRGQGDQVSKKPFTSQRRGKRGDDSGGSAWNAQHDAHDQSDEDVDGGDSDENLVDYLLPRLDMFGYWSRQGSGSRLERRRREAVELPILRA
ncbi:hypothetical protein HRR83_005429 [Exophiala dermatitidis]|uniref:Spindle pole body component n=2 Tax=Exophiala dermatitidis TaxID=5970 RepID=H6C4P3_EXODN|nr:uncharacterized protein HMPREF1120_05693 [Exophiala dermatitidis NIH/UT8656]KAJ4513073.1 hypothetical protein HRR75_004840 [Exophiala dermatitidis]EHY57664.1 hypothetical protein HMPREF1120_05693 [Exophiala dermatitidis NIH/UT8656]KAJ4516125.1 hypothetical protein HRR74_005282 [Exophiala dermatitidis]KAJ4518472.1 hypothetical protein HRR73_004053 [Exophiala dermatitidis]KAJ4533968.1 hypothetical protein HRR76_005917 [Exophiala dermatitidis]